MISGAQLFDLGLKHLGERYENVPVPKDNPNWRGPWDCAEFVSWVVYQKLSKLYGCLKNSSPPATADSYSGSWARDCDEKILIPADLETAVRCAGVVLVRRPPSPGRMGHVALSDGFGGTIEAMSSARGVVRGKVEGRTWHCFARIPDVDYSRNEATSVRDLSAGFTLSPDGKNPVDLVRSLQGALVANGVDPGNIDGVYGPHTVAAVYAFQKMNHLVSDGYAGPAVADLLGVPWPTRCVHESIPE